MQKFDSAHKAIGVTWDIKWAVLRAPADPTDFSHGLGQERALGRFERVPARLQIADLPPHEIDLAWVSLALKLRSGASPPILLKNSEGTNGYCDERITPMCSGVVPQQPPMIWAPMRRHSMVNSA